MSSIIAIRRKKTGCDVFGEATGWAQWYYKVSHPLIIPPHSIGPSNIVEISYYIPPPGMNERHKMEIMALLSDNLMDFINPYAEVYALATQIALGGLT